jgi:hypothetical protein
MNKKSNELFAKTMMSAALAGVITGCNRPESNVTTSDSTSSTAVAVERKSESEDKTGRNERYLINQEKHICRGLNLCKGQGKGQKNECAGLGSCATAQKHACDGLNSCKGQGGCGEFPGQNACKGQGSCAVPLKDATWAKARKKFEELLNADGKKFGPAPSKES